MDDAARHLATALRQTDPDRFLCSLFAPAARRPVLWVLYALHHELARARDVASNPDIARMRLIWWAEVVQGTDRTVPLAPLLRQAIAAGDLPEADLLALIDAYDDQITQDRPDTVIWRGQMLAGPGGVAALAAKSLGATPAEQDRARQVGAAYGLADLLRQTAGLARRGVVRWPADPGAAPAIDADLIRRDPGHAAAASARAALVAIGRGWLQAGLATPPRRRLRAAFLPGVLARRDFHRPPPPGRGRLLGDRLAVARVAVLGGW